MSQKDLSRRDFLKLSGVAAGTLAIAASGVASLPTIALADTADKTYTVTANLYVDKSDSPIGANAYVTNDGVPPFNKPTSPVSDNATLVVTSTGKKLLTVPIVNATFGVLSIASASTDGSVTVTATEMGTWTLPNFLWSTPYDERITSITFDVTNFSGGETIATFSPCAEYASFPLYKGDKSWDLHLIADLSAAE